MKYMNWLTVRGRAYKKLKMTIAMSMSMNF